MAFVLRTIKLSRVCRITDYTATSRFPVLLRLGVPGESFFFGHFIEVLIVLFISWTLCTDYLPHGWNLTAFIWSVESHCPGCL
jgi:hypothetical protein